jgi:predicted Zn-ribbon and HTH transcriptional regulator
VTNYDYRPRILDTQTPSDEYKRGWYDGYQAAQRDLTNTKHYIPPINPAVCKGCGMDLRKMTHYVCNLSSCPTRVSC